ncbi:MAG: hypothetical protein DF168_00882 [Candidatus Moanabacter tarae]|uniref:Outer membrane lipoprotein-sorting protein n=1 Tax=Candidatus Moanibacter tarae TaxID=2200854 RepID=A0A2Z4AFD7_9BACT|nr:MAG: hypothetical protein DF168_00882 [Candidatus Moanabacter tarae]
MTDNHRNGGIFILLFLFLFNAKGDELRLDEVDAFSALEEFRYQGISEKYSLSFLLLNIPNEGEETYHRGQIWGNSKNDGTRTVIRLEPVAGNGEAEIRLFLENGIDPVAWRIRKGTKTLRMIKGASLFFPLFPGLVLTPFELQMPFLFWEDYIYEGVSKLKGRRAFMFLMIPPLAIRKANPDMEAVRVSIDTKFKVLIKAQILGPRRQTLKSFKIVSLKKIQNQVIIKRIDFLDEISRNKTRFIVTGADLSLVIDDVFFRPDTLLEERLPRPSNRFEHF